MAPTSGVTSRMSCTRVVLSLLTLGFPLGVVLVVVLRLPAEELVLSSTDMRLLRPLSTFWCGWQEVTSTHPFLAYKVPQAPPIESSAHLSTFAFRFTLMRGQTHLLRYHLLEGSSIDGSGCASMPMALLKIVGGEEELNWCWGSEKEGLSSEENSGEAFGSPDINGLVERLHGTVARKCPSPLSSSLLSLDEHSNSTPTCRPSFQHEVKVSRTGFYYMLVGGRQESSGVNHVLLHVRLNRTSFSLPEDMMLCRSQSRCEIPLTFGSSELVVVFMSAEPDAGSVSFPVRSKCKPRVVLYLLVFLLLPLLFALALAFAVRTVRHRHTPGWGAAPLLEPLKPEGRGSTPPPPYNQLDLPPPYETALAYQRTTQT